MWARIDYFSTVSHAWLAEFVQHRIADRRVLRLIRKWLTAGVMEDGQLTWQEEGTVQGASISPLLSNLYLHHVLDWWAKHWRSTKARGDVIIVRYADDFIMGFEHRDDAERFRADLTERLVRFGLELHPDKTRLIEFGRFAARNRKQRGEGKPETFSFLGFTHICARAGKGHFVVKRVTDRSRLRAKLGEVRAELRRRMHDPVPAQGAWLNRVVQGHFRYYAVPTNVHRLSVFRVQVTRLWRMSLNRRSHKARITWERMARLRERWLPQAKILHPWPSERFDVIHPR